MPPRSLMVGVKGSVKKALLKLTEADIQRTVVGLMVADGWRPWRTEHAIERHEGGTFKRKVGEVGMPDYLFLRYSLIGSQIAPRLRGFVDPSTCSHLWIEFKATGKKPDKDQLTWHERERRIGALVIVVDDIEAFRGWYAASGLQRER